MSRLLPQSFYARDALIVAKALLGHHIHVGDVVLRITEVEAYPTGDSASHCRMGKTARNAPMWGPPGYAYVYLCYGMHHMLNVVTNRAGEGAAVLIRACEPVRGLQRIENLRGASGPALLTGPGKVGAALGLDTTWSGERLFSRGRLELREGRTPGAILCGPRIGIGYANREHQLAPWRLAIAESAWVSKPGQLSSQRETARGVHAASATSSVPGPKGVSRGHRRGRVIGTRRV